MLSTASAGCRHCDPKAHILKHEIKRDGFVGKPRPAKRFAAAVSVAALVLDLGTKAWARASLPSPDGLELLPFLALRPRYNDGTTFGLLSGGTTLSLAVLVMATLLVVLVLGWWAAHAEERWVTFGASLMAAGALGNLVDRLIVGMVTDFVDVHISSWNSPIFNLADIWMIFGLFLVLVGARKKERI